ncbi:protein kinase domain-containing protein [Verrucomicrobiota bacterium sgz303538]
MTESTENLQTCPSCQSVLDITGVEPLARVECPTCGTAVVVSQFIAHYELIEIVGRGGMGVVYKARDTNLDRYVALKVLRKDHSQNAELVAQLDTEAAITASINHPHVVRVFTTGSDQGRFFIAMELVDKGTLDDLINLQGQVAEAQVLEIAIQISQGLRAAYQHGLIHRDVKPGNILFSDSHTAKIVDFGLAMLEAASQGGGEIWGTPYYVAPEKLDQKPEDFRSDIYSLGATLFHALAGRPPFEAEDATMVALKHLKSQAVSLQAFAPHVSGSTAYVINRTLLKDPDQRYQSYDELIEHLEYARTEVEQKGTQPQSKKRVVLETEEDQKLWSYVTFGMLGLAVVLGAGGWWYFAKRSDSTPSAAPATVLSVSSGADAKQTKQYQDARQALLDGKYAEAAKAFHVLTADSKTPSPLLQWSFIHEGLSELLAGHTAEARTAFSGLQAREMPTRNQEERDLASFFHELAKLMTSDQPTPAASAAEFSRENFATIAPLLLGLKNWQMAQFDEAGPLLRQFQSASPRDEYVWIADYKSLAGDYLADFTEYRGASELAKMANSPEAERQTEERLAQMSKNLRTQGKLAERFASLAKELKAKSEIWKLALTQKVALDRKTLDAARPRLAELSQAWKFDEARKHLSTVQTITEEGRRERYVLDQKLGWLENWKTHTIGELVKPGSKITLRRKNGSELKGAITKATQDGLDFKDSGHVSWNDIAPESIVATASTAYTSSSNAELLWGTGVFAAMSGQNAEAEKLLLAAAKASPEFVSALPLLLPSARPTDKNLAIDAKLTSSGFTRGATYDQGPANVLDGDPKTKWFGTGTGPVWLQVDFGEPKSICRWLVRHAHSGGELVELNSVDFELQASPDGQNWQTIDRVTSNYEDTTRRIFSPTSTRYARLLFTSPSRRKGDTAARITEIELNGAASTGSEDLAQAFFEPSGWFDTPRLMSKDIGKTKETGSTEANTQTGEFVLQSWGEDIWLKEDSFRFVSRKIQGDGEIVARITSIADTDEWAKAGVMFRETREANAKNVFAGLTPGTRATLQSRAQTGGESTSSHEAGNALPHWLKLTRKGDKFTVSISPDGSKWKEFRTTTVSMKAEVYVGLALAAHNKNGMCSATFDYVQISGQPAVATPKTTTSGAVDGKTAQTPQAETQPSFANKS